MDASDPAVGKRKITFAAEQRNFPSNSALWSSDRLKSAVVDEVAVFGGPGHTDEPVPIMAMGEQR